MKHHLRREKNCLNCGAEVTGRYCPHCGQENTEPKDSFGHLLLHFFSDVTHFDSKLFITLKDLLIKPGFLSKEYFAGRRSRYLDPVRMYLFISFVFFLVMFLQKDREEPLQHDEYASYPVNAVRQQLADSLRIAAALLQNKTAHDSIRKDILKSIASRFDTTVSPGEKEELISFHFGSGGARFILQEERYNNTNEYDSVQQSLNEKDRDKGFLRWMIRTNISLKSRYGGRRQVLVTENFDHNIPKLMFVLLPLFALLLYIFHRRKKFYYTQHIIFSIHFHSFMFLLSLLVMVINNWILPGNKVADYLTRASLVIILFYFIVALRNTYQQAAGWAIVKALSISILYIILLAAGILVLAFISFFTA